MSLKVRGAVVLGKPCTHGHDSGRYAKGNECAECVRSRAKRRYAADPEKVKAINNAWRKRNPEDAQKADRKYAAANPERIKANHLRWRKANPEKHNANGLKWQKENPAKHAAKIACYRAHKLKATPVWLTAEQKSAILDFYQNASVRGLEVDHIIPLRGKVVCGLHVPWNLQFLTRSENASKSNNVST